MYAQHPTSFGKYSWSIFQKSYTFGHGVVTPCRFFSLVIVLCGHGLQAITIPLHPSYYTPLLSIYREEGGIVGGGYRGMYSCRAAVAVPQSCSSSILQDNNRH